MGKDNNSELKSRRWFLSLFGSANTKKGKVKMLTADCKLVEIDQSVLDAASKKQRSSNKEIYDWMQNPSKENKG